MPDTDSLTLAITQIHTMVKGPYMALEANHTAEQQAILELLYNVIVVCEAAVPSTMQGG